MNIQFMQALMFAVRDYQCLAGLSQEKSSGTQELMFSQFHVPVLEKMRNMTVEPFLMPNNYEVSQQYFFIVRMEKPLMLC